MAIQRLLPNAASLCYSEFWTASDGFRVTGDCGESAASAALVCSSLPIESNAQAQALMHSLTDEMVAKKTASGSGATTMAHLHDEVVSRKATVDSSSFISFSQPLPDMTAFHTLLLNTAGVKPIVLEVATAGAGLHAVDGSHAEAGVQYHFICVVGIANEGYVCYDGDNNNIWNGLPIYSWGAIEAATPCAVMVLEMGWGSNLALPAGWHDSGTALSNPVNAFVVTQGFRDYILAHPWDADDAPWQNVEGVADVEESNPGLGAGTAQAFKRSRLIWTAADGQIRLQSLGVEYLFVRADRDKQKAAAAASAAQANSYKSQLATAQSALDAANGQVKADAAQIASLQAQVAALQAQLQAPPPVPPVPESDADKAAVAYVEAEAAVEKAQVAVTTAQADEAAKLEDAKKLLNL